MLDGTLASSEAQAAGIWRVREGVTEALVRRGAVHKYDLSMPVATMYELVEEMRRRVADLPGVRVVGYGKATGTAPSDLGRRSCLQSSDHSDTQRSKVSFGMSTVLVSFICD